MRGVSNKLRRIKRWLSEQGLPTEPELMTPDLMYTIQRGLDVKETSKQEYLQVLGRWVEWETGQNPVRRAKLLWNSPSYEVVRITADEFRELLGKVRFAGDKRLEIILLLGGLMGLRRTEISKIKIGDLRDNSILVHGKGHGEQGKVQLQPMPSAVKKEILAFIKGRSKEEYLIPLTVNVFREQVITDLFVEASKTYGLHVTPHSLRRLYATTLYRNGTDILTICKLMRHDNPQTTWRYIQESTIDMENAMNDVTKTLYTQSAINI